MGLPAGQQRVLESIESSLRVTEPKLASMYAIFTRLTRGEPRPYREQLPDRRSLRARTAAFRRSMALRRARARQLRRQPAPAGARSLMRPAARPRRPLLRLLFIGQLMAILAVIGVLIGLGSSMAPAGCTTQVGIGAAAAHSQVTPAVCRGSIGK
jgi:hypothetical protein